MLVAPLVAASLLLAGGPAEDDSSPPAPLDGLRWLAGCWEGRWSDSLVHEQWMKPEGGSMLGASRTVAGGETVGHEFMRIVSRDDGVVYLASPGGRTEVAFRLVTSESHEAVFENLEHDFPQRIIYRLATDGGLAAAIEGPVRGQTKRIEFPMKRVACE